MLISGVVLNFLLHFAGGDVMNQPLNKSRYCTFLKTLLFIVVSLLIFQNSTCPPEDETDKSKIECKINSVEISLTHSSITISPGTSRNIDVDYIASTTGCDGRFVAHLIGNIPAGITATECSSHLGTGSCTLTISVLAGTPDGTYTITIEGYVLHKNGKYKPHTRTLEVIVNSPPEFFISGPPLINVLQDDSSSITINVSRIGGHSESIDLTLESLPVRLTHIFTPNPIPGNQTSSQLKITAQPNAIIGEYNMVVRGTDGTNEDATPLALHVNEPFHFPSDLNPDTVTIAQGQSDFTNIRIERHGGYSKFVLLTAEASIIGQGANFVDTTFQTNPIQGIESRLTFSVGESVPPNSYTILITGTAGNIIRSFEMELIVTE